MNKVLVASNNKNKIIEIKNIFKLNDFDVEIVCPKDLNCNDEPDENGNSFEENAYIKAKYYFDKYNLPTIADDSGICIDFYNGGPGIHSARFLSGLNYKDKNEYILTEMKDATNRNASFVDVICYIDENSNVSYFKGIQDGEISYEQKGDKGFGYDPIFYVPKFNKTEAELGDEYKNVYSHRAIALKKWIDYVKSK